MSKINFNVENFSIADTISDEQFAIVEVYVCHDGNNHHNMPISLKTLKMAAKTLKNKFLVAGFDGRDFKEHESDEMIVGFFPESSNISYKKKDGKTFLVAEAIMSKVYANWAYEQFVKKNHRGVSMEIIISKLGKAQEIQEFSFMGVTILGDKYPPACEGSDISVVKFTKEVVDDVSKVYGKYSWKENDDREEEVDFMVEEIKDPIIDEVEEDETDKSFVEEAIDEEDKDFVEETDDEEDKGEDEEADVDEDKKEEEFSVSPLEEEYAVLKKKYAELEVINENFKAVIAEYEAEKKDAAVESILADPKIIDVLDVNKINELRDDSKNFSLDNLNDFANKAKAAAFEAFEAIGDVKSKYGFSRMPLNKVEDKEEKKTGKYSW